MNLDELTARENASIRAFLEPRQHLLVGRVLDYGCGRMPYRDLVSGTYCPWDRADLPFSMAARDQGKIDGLYDAILCTQVIQYVNPLQLGGWLNRLRSLLWRGDHLVLTGPTNWPDINDLARYSLTGIVETLTLAGWKPKEFVYRDAWLDEDRMLPHGYGVVAVA